MSDINSFLQMCVGSLALSFFVMLLAGVLLVILFAVVFRSVRVREFFRRQRAALTQEAPISDSDEIEVMEEELDDTQVGSPESDLEILDIDAATL